MNSDVNSETSEDLGAISDFLTGEETGDEGDLENPLFFDFLNNHKDAFLSYNSQSNGQPSPPDSSECSEISIPNVTIKKTRKRKLDEFGNPKQRKKREKKKLEGVNVDENGQKMKRPVNAFVLYSQSRMPKLQADFPTMSPVEMSKIAAQEWKFIDQVRYGNELKIIRCFIIRDDYDYCDPRSNLYDWIIYY